ncbi:hypothetical protein EYF80_050939 [Liparis tanakae]|uniref:Uncharacterized protein n=1 Tax=Liparis tanakae TaxID=230148 RepID=A0A4Z2FD39_9TELE|nr:hypothetical protein EYF80_050939 [Liparis tanakae]
MLGSAFRPTMDRGPTEGVGGYPSIQSVHSQDAMVADLLQQAAEAGGVVEGHVVLDQGHGMVSPTQQQLMEAGVGVDGGAGVEMMVMDSLDPTLMQMKTEVW